MSNRTDPWPTGYPQRGVTLMPFDLPGRSIVHEFNRERTVASVLADVHLMAVRGIIPKGAKVSYEGAHLQSREGHEGNEAAHCLPRQIVVKGKYLYEFVEDIDPSRALAIKGKFGEADDLPANFNKADSRIERRGLADAFAVACSHALEAGQNGGTFDVGAVLGIVKATYDVFSTQANIAMISASSRINERLTQINAQRGNSPQKQEDLKKYQEQSEITQIYQETLADSPGEKEFNTQSTIEGYIKIYSTL